MENNINDKIFSRFYFLHYMGQNSSKNESLTTGEIVQLGQEKLINVNDSLKKINLKLER